MRFYRELRPHRQPAAVRYRMTVYGVRLYAQKAFGILLRNGFA